MAPEEDRIPLHDSTPRQEEEPVTETVILPVPSPRYDEESDGSVGNAPYGEDYSRMGQAYTNDRKAREIPIPHIGDEDGTGYRIPGEGKSRSKLRPFFALLLVGLMAAGIFAAATYGLELWGGTTVPNVQGITEARARTMLEEAGFAVETKTRIADDGIGFVIDQEPARGTRVESGSTVSITIAVSRTMPQVVGLAQNEAIDLLTKAGAENIEVVGKQSNKAEGTVLEVSPDQGQSFAAYQTITLTVSKKPLVPDVIGKDKVEAVAIIEAAGFVADVQFVNETGTTNSVLRTDPKTDAKADPGSTIHLYVVEPMPADPLNLLDYFGKGSPNIAHYLTEKGFKLTGSFLSPNKEAEALYTSDAYGVLCFCNNPFSHAYIHSQNTGEDVLADDHPWTGIRWEIPKTLLPKSASKLDEQSVRDIMTRCGLTSLLDVCTESDIQMPAETAKTKASFRCAYGEVGGNCWTILLVKEPSGSVRGVVTCAPIDYYMSSFDLEPYGKSICDFVACSDVYTEL